MIVMYEKNYNAINFILELIEIDGYIFNTSSYLMLSTKSVVLTQFNVQ